MNAKGGSIVSVDLTVPPWLNQYIRAWLDRFHLNDWTIKVAVELCVDGDPGTHALTQQWPDLNMAKVTFRADVADNPEWRRTVIHELIHVAHSRVDHAVERALIPYLSEPAQPLARIVYHQHVESYVAYLANTLYRATVGVDYPEEQAPDDRTIHPTT